MYIIKNPSALWRQNKKKLLAVIIVTLLIILATKIQIAFAWRPLVQKSLIIEAGEPLPQIDEFIIAEGKTGAFLSALPIDSIVPGAYPVIIAVGKKTFNSTIIIQDTIPPKALPTTVFAWVGEKLSPQEFVCDIDDQTPVEISFISKPNTMNTGLSYVTVQLTDAGNNTLNIISELHVYKAIERLEIPPKLDKNQITALSFIENASQKDEELFKLETDLQEINFDTPGWHEVIISLAGKKYWCILDILDITPPAATPLHLYKYIGDTCEAQDFVTNIVDETPVSVSFIAEPNYLLEGEQTVGILLKDTYNNTTEIVSALTLSFDTEPPIISGLLDKTVFDGTAIAYRADITVTDNRDEEVLLKIDSSAVDQNTAGKYPVIYSATDSSGNTTVAEGSITVLNVSQKQVYEMANILLKEIINTYMSPYEKAYAIYMWVRNHIFYINTSPKEDSNIAAYSGLKDRRGDCFVYACVAQLLLTTAGIDNTLVHRIPSARVCHYWNLVNTGEGWYHFDSTPHQNGGDCFMLTEDQAQALAKIRGKDYYSYDTSLYPEVMK
ncbi:MAG: hypothetical protein FWG61_05590 [Firmicutes bacterium]|nr:hypothetical protein [Bacillota bacterium]